jgi:hypothetical protein
LRKLIRGTICPPESCRRAAMIRCIALRSP